MSEIKMWGIHAESFGQVDSMFLDKKSPCIAISWDEILDLSKTPVDRKFFKTIYNKIFQRLRREKWEQTNLFK